MSDEKPRGLKTLQLMIALHEAAHIVALRVFAGVGSRVALQEWDGETAYAFTKSIGDVSRADHITSLVAALVITDEIHNVLPGLLQPRTDWAEIRKLTGLGPEELRVTPTWKTVSVWVECARKGIGAVAKEIVAGRTVFELGEE